MTKLILSAILFIGLAVNAQNKNLAPAQLKRPPAPPGTKITFSYDGEGNQIQRTFCTSCTSKIASPELLEDLLKTVTDDKITFYPNPVNEELYLKWELVADKAVANIYLYDLNGRVLQKYNSLNRTNILTIKFFNYPAGEYLVVMVYNNAEQKSLKIIKQ